MSQNPNRPSVEQVYAAANAVGISLGNYTYAVVGGAACTVLGSKRGTDDVDFVVPQGQTSCTRTRLGAQPTFRVVSGSLHTHYRSTPEVEIEILTPPALWAETFDSSTPTIQIGSVKILKPTLILNAKCRSILGRPSEIKRRNDANDIQFLLNWCTTHGVRPTAPETPNINNDFVQWFNDIFECPYQVWTNAGYEFQKGLSSVYQNPIAD
jgi:hypothetical protein